MKGLKITLIFLLVFIILLSCTKTKEESSIPIVATSILPQHWFVSQIAGDFVDIVVLVGEGQSPHSYEITPSQMTSLAKASFWLLSGTEFEINLVPKIKAQFPKLKIVDGTRGVIFRKLENHHHEHENKDNYKNFENSHEHSNLENLTNLDRHTWLGRGSAILLSDNSLQALKEILPEKSEELKQNHKKLVQEIENAFDELKEKLAFLRGRSVLVFHPSFGYFLDEFGIEQTAIEVGGKEPSAKQLSEIISKAKIEKSPAIFVQKQFSTAAAKAIAEQTGSKIISLDPLSKDWLSNIKFIGEQLFETHKN